MPLVDVTHSKVDTLACPQYKGSTVYMYAYVHKCLANVAVDWVLKTDFLAWVPSCCGRHDVSPYVSVTFMSQKQCSLHRHS